MAIFLLDTSVIIDVINDTKNRRKLMRDLLTAGNTLACCSINVTEVYAGMRPHEEESTQNFLLSLKYYSIDWQTSRMAGLLKRDYGKKGITLAATDVTIAAVALSHHLSLMTDNLKDFPMKELEIFPLP